MFLSPVEILLEELLEGRTGSKQVKRDPYLSCPLQQFECSRTADPLRYVYVLGWMWFSFLETTGERHRHRKVLPQTSLSS